MKRSAIIIVTVLLAGFVAVSVWKRTQRTRSTSDTAVESGSELSEERKAEIRRFWDLYRRATDLKNKGEWQEAANAYGEALAINGRHEDALYYYGNILFELQDYDAAVTAWRALTDVNPLSARAHIQLGAVHSCGVDGTPFDLGVAEREFQRAHAINKEETGPILKLGEVCLLRGDSPRARSYFETALQTNAKSVEAHYLIGYIEWHAGDKQAALSALSQAVQLSRAKRPTGQPLGEGDTRSGGGPILAEGASRKSFFGTHWTALKTWEEEASADKMEEEYRDLDSRFRSLTGR